MDGDIQPPPPGFSIVTYIVLRGIYRVVPHVCTGSEFDTRSDLAHVVK